MATVTLQLEDALLERVRALAASRQSTVDAVVADELHAAEAARREIPANVNPEKARSTHFDEAIAKFAIYDTGAPYARDQMNER